MNNIYTLTKWMIIEEIRSFYDLFSKRNLLLFPIIIFLLTLGLSYTTVTYIEITTTTILLYFIFMFLFGLQTGKIGFESRDNLQGFSNLRIVFLSRTLPISKQRILTSVIIKELIIYSLLFLLPIFIALIVAIHMISSISITFIIIGYIFTLLSFVLGISFGFYVTTISNMKHVAVFVKILVISTITAYIYNTTPQLFELSLYAYIPIMLLISLLFTIIGIYQFNIRSHKERTKLYKNSRLLNKHRSPIINIVLKTLIDVQRTKGGIGKLLYTTGILSLIIHVIVFAITQTIPTDVSYSILYATLLSMTVFPIYSILFQYDSKKTYTTHGFSEKQYWISKSYLFVGISTLVVGIYYTLFTIYYTVAITEYIIGLVIITAMILYQLYVLLSLAGEKPTKFLFNGNVFFIYNMITAVISLPFIIYGLFGGIINITYILIFVFGLAILAVGIVFKLYIDNIAKQG